MHPIIVDLSRFVNGASGALRPGLPPRFRSRSRLESPRTARSRGRFAARPNYAFAQEQFELRHHRVTRAA